MKLLNLKNALLVQILFLVDIFSFNHLKRRNFNRLNNGNFIETYLIYNNAEYSFTYQWINTEDLNPKSWKLEAKFKKDDYNRGLQDLISDISAESLDLKKESYVLIKVDFDKIENLDFKSFEDIDDNIIQTAKIKFKKEKYHEISFYMSNESADNLKLVYVIRKPNIFAPVKITTKSSHNIADKFLYTAYLQINDLKYEGNGLELYIPKKEQLKSDDILFAYNSILNYMKRIPIEAGTVTNFFFPYRTNEFKYSDFGIEIKTDDKETFNLIKEDYIKKKDNINVKNPFISKETFDLNVESNSKFKLNSFEIPEIESNFKLSYEMLLKLKEDKITDEYIKRFYKLAKQIDAYINSRIPKKKSSAVYGRFKYNIIHEFYEYTLQNKQLSWEYDIKRDNTVNRLKNALLISLQTYVY